MEVKIQKKIKKRLSSAGRSRHSNVTSEANQKKLLLSSYRQNYNNVSQATLQLKNANSWRLELSPRDTSKDRNWTQRASPVRRTTELKSNFDETELTQKVKRKVRRRG